MVFIENYPLLSLQNNKTYIPTNINDTHCIVLDLFKFKIRYTHKKGHTSIGNPGNKVIKLVSGLYIRN